MYKEWFPYLNNNDKENLLKGRKINDDNLIICQQLEYRKYAIFNDYLEFSSYQKLTSENHNCYYEILLENRPRKPYFDIDIDKDNFEEDPNQIIEQLKEKIIEFNPELQLLIYSSHTDKKYSYHIVIGNVYLNNHKECKNFCCQFIDSMSEIYQVFIDKSVYKSVQQFRILNSHKYNKVNTKLFREDLSINFIIPDRYTKTPKGKDNYLLTTSLLSNITGCTYMDGYQNIEEKTILERGFSSSGDLEDVMELVYSQYPGDLFSYLTHHENDGNLLVTFKRNYSSYCKLCKRHHENENPFVIVRGITRNIHFYCRRHEKESLMIGSLGPLIIPDLKVEDIPIIEEMEPGDDFEIIDDLKNMEPKKKGKYKAKLNLDDWVFPS